MYLMSIVKLNYLTCGNPIWYKLKDKYGLQARCAREKGTQIDFVNHLWYSMWCNKKAEKTQNTPIFIKVTPAGLNN